MFSFTPQKHTQRVLARSTRFLSSGATNVEQPSLLQYVYVHHVSQTVLQHMQDKQSAWLCRHGLDRGLQLASNGTFCLSFPSRPGYDAGRVWTWYDPVQKQHWLSVYRHHKIIGRFLLLDSRNTLRTRSQHPLIIMDEMRRHIGDTVDHMISYIDEHERRTDNGGQEDK
ncbi:hypothetical protein FisN_2Lh381 [Fistulifera solaris]|uniref:Uncharacterized protein n=1 Tax=Fistulifera solaris TaxID=1519565 RepID=A0A1Z5JPB2_FISSO|nr:hypothetical protein FisN_2Lh381 [Fistulifera solaris]|eukprot:GAX15883.1 hypothetical protein FisN_2Lh381 [Fistulifera solaris]